ncbi:uncharacterized protein LOC130649570 isoform X2 [Hydractinia symbiolongicarpus]|uniref:uncharacterized protein LOC130649570 isoform X2 n=1 Tax=Hydractinia symbiolongicarpus TaxID=13093 RepID=UPI00254E4969|nr:uncharacterized protein LOC130649570 isoform X2 [Hydractinia symbiolongicarpus]
MMDTKLSQHPSPAFEIGKIYKARENDRKIKLKEILLKKRRKTLEFWPNDCIQVLRFYKDGWYIASNLNLHHLKSGLIHSKYLDVASEIDILSSKLIITDGESKSLSTNEEETEIYNLLPGDDDLGYNTISDARPRVRPRPKTDGHKYENITIQEEDEGNYEDIPVKPKQRPRSFTIGFDYSDKDRYVELREQESISSSKLPLHQPVEEKSVRDGSQQSIPDILITSGDMPEILPNVNEEEEVEDNITDFPVDPMKYKRTKKTPSWAMISRGQSFQSISSDDSVSIPRRPSGSTGFLRDMRMRDRRHLANQLDGNRNVEKLGHLLKEKVGLSTVQIENLVHGGYSPCEDFLKVYKTRKPSLKTKAFKETMEEMERYDVLAYMKDKSYPQLFFETPYEEQDHIAMFLNCSTNNWRTFAGRCGYSSKEITTIESNKPKEEKSPAEYLFTIITHQCPSFTIEDLKIALTQLKRQDLVEYLSQC